jgi:molybdate transport system substrate-binding protein
MRRVAAALVSLALCLPFAAARAAEPVYVFAAASLKGALDEAARAYAGQRPVLVYGASSRLAQQIERGAPAALFISADAQWMDYLAARGAILPETRRDLLGNRLVLIAPRASALQIRIEPGMPLAQALGGGRLALGDPAHVPAGLYARAALE